MSTDVYPLLQLMLDDMNQAPALYRPTSFWQKAVAEIVEAIQDNGIERFRSFPSALRFMVPTYAYPYYHFDSERYGGLHKALAQAIPAASQFDIRLKNFLSGRLLALADYRVYLASSSDLPPYTDQVSESQVGDPVEQFTFDGRLFSRSFLNYLLGINFLKSTCSPKRIRSVLEIGGGYGTLGEILLGDRRNDCFYLNVDIPPTSFVSTYYLQQVFGSSEVGDYGTLQTRSSIEIDELSKNFRAVILCPWQLPRVNGNIDLFVNYISFQEMEPDVVANYCHHICRLKPCYILLRNLREGKQVVKDAESLGVKTPLLGTDYDRFFPGYEIAGTNTIPFGHKTEDGFHSELRLYVNRHIHE